MRQNKVSKFALATAVVVGSSLAASASASFVVFEQNFANPGSSGLPLDNFGWQAHWDADATAYPTNITAGNPNISSSPGFGGVKGFLFHPGNLNNTQPHIWWTETSIGPVEDLDTFSFASANVRGLDQTANPVDFVQVALRVDGEWYVSQEAFATPVGNNWSPHLLDFDTALFYELDFTPGVSLAETAPSTPAVLPPTSTVSALGLYNVSKDNAMRLDAVTVTAIPEPASIAALGLGGMVLLRRRHQ
ncbi:MAG: PEP-CTERM sorting domain-containing protein [Phycisphaerae bacterium]